MLIVDTFNVLHTKGVLPADLAAPGVPGLVRLIARSRYVSRDCTLVCDGVNAAASSGIRLGHARVLYAGSGREADDVIEILIDRYHRGNRLEVVSSDARLRKAARRRRAVSIPSDVFLAHLADDARRPPRVAGPTMREQVPLDRYSVNAWLDEFGIPDLAPEPRSAPDAEAQNAVDLPHGAAHAGPTATPAPDSTPAERARPKKRRPRPAPPAASLGSTLGIELPTPAPVPASAAPPPPPAPSPSVSPPPAAPPRDSDIPDQGSGAGGTAAGGGRADGPPAGVDPLLLRALEEWRDRLTLDDLDMQQWIPDATPLDPRRRKP